jgi:hypothetical protein
VKQRQCPKCPAIISDRTRRRVDREVQRHIREDHNHQGGGPDPRLPMPLWLRTVFWLAVIIALAFTAGPIVEAVTGR